MFSLKKVLFILNKEQKKYLYFVSFLILISMFLEALSVGIVLPLFSILLKGEMTSNYFSNFLSFKNFEGDNLIYFGLIVALSIFVFKNLFLIFNHNSILKFAEKTEREISSKLFKYYLKKDYIFFLQRNTADLIRNIESEVGSFVAFVNMYIVLVTETIVSLGIIAVLFYVDLLSTIIILTCVITFIIIIYMFTKKKIEVLGQDRVKVTGQMIKHLYQGLFAAKDVKILDREQDLVDQVYENIFKLTRIGKDFTFINGLPRFLFEILIVFVFVTLVIYMMMAGREMIEIIQYLGVFAVASFRIGPSAVRIFASLQQLKFRQPSVNNLYEEFDLKDFKIIKEKSIKKNSDLAINFKEEVNLINLNFSYPSRKEFNISGISMNIKKGDFVGIIGETGSGKSTLINLFTGLLHPSSGKIESDRCNIFSNLPSWHKKIGYVPQSIYLIDDSIRKNIAFGMQERFIDDSLVKQAVKRANLDTLIEDLPDGIETIVGEKGIRLSGGQQQRIGIARALYRDPEILILDEATSSLDFITERKIMNSVQILKRTKTLIVVTHRLSTIENCDKVFFIDKGVIKKEGSPEEVLKYLK